MQGRICDRCRYTAATATRDGKDYCQSCFIMLRTQDRVDKVYEAAKDEIKAFQDAMIKYRRSGVYDTEGRYAMHRWFKSEFLGVSNPRITFEYLDGYMEHRPTEDCPYEKDEIALAIGTAAKKALDAVTRAANAQRLDVEDHAELLAEIVV